jgi:hypothetical protein
VLRDLSLHLTYLVINALDECVAALPMLSLYMSILCYIKALRIYGGALVAV